MAKITINNELCKGCGLCVENCPKKILELSKTCSNDKGYFYVTILDMSKCIGCASCAVMCPDSVIEVER